MSANPPPLATDPYARRRLAALAVILAAGTVYVWWMVQGNPPSDQPDAAHGTVAAVVPGMVGRDRCAECHVDEAAAHALSGHSRTLARTKDSAVAKSKCGTVVPAADGYVRFDYSCDEQGLLVAATEKFGDKSFPLDFAFGSGDHAVTFLTLIHAVEAEDGLLGIEHRQTWFRSTQAFGVTPGHQGWIPEREIEYFGKAHQGETLRRCISCHTTNFRIAGDQLVDLIPGVQCESCHGPGEAHVRAAESKQIAFARQMIHTPQSPADEIRECGRCHRLPEDIEPERLERYPPSLTRFQPVGLMRSACFLKSEGRLGCLNCHDAHGSSAANPPAAQDASCRNCHQTGGDPECAAGQPAQCVKCHLRRLEIVPGFTIHDHWIRTRPPADISLVGDSEVTASGEPDAK